MDSLLRAAIRRRELEAEQLALEGDTLARPLCLRCGGVLQSERLASLRHAACGGRLPRKRQQEAMDKFTDDRRELLQRIADRVEVMDRLYGILTKERLNE